MPWSVTLPVKLEAGTAMTGHEEDAAGTLKLLAKFLVGLETHGRAGHSF